jgi:hypothetical protein
VLQLCAGGNLLNQGQNCFNMVSIGITFAQFCVIVVWSLIKPCLGADWWCRRNQDHDVINDDIAHERIEDPELEPLINITPRPITMAASTKYTHAVATKGTSFSV